MKIKATLKAFTLIELLVVITIIGILATGATTVYTSQIQKARDTTRISDMKSLQSAIEQAYQDSSSYPTAQTLVTEIITYMEKLPKDPKHAQPCNDWWIPANAPECAYSYVAWDDNNGIEYWEYEISTALENEWNVTKKAALDGGWTGVELTRLEFWLDIVNNVSSVPKNAVTSQIGACTFAWQSATLWTSIIVLNWNPSDYTDSQCR